MVKKLPIPDEVRRFILVGIPSVPYLEALLLLRSRPGESWAPALVARRLYVGEAQAVSLMQALVDGGIVAAAADGSYQYSPGDEQLQQVIDALAATYAADLVGVTTLIHSRVDKRALQLADAFRWTNPENPPWPR